MGQAKKRGTYEERKAQAIIKREAHYRLGREQRAIRRIELDQLSTEQVPTEPSVKTVGTGGFGNGRSRKARLMTPLLATLLAASYTNSGYK